MNVGLVLRNHDVLRAVEGGDREAYSEVGEEGLIAELRLGMDSGEELN